MPQLFHRVRLTWLAYLMLAFYAFFLNIFGPITPFLKSELNLSYTISSLHFSAFAVGIILIGLVGNRIIQRLGRWHSLWIGAAGISLGALGVVIGKSSVVTIGSAFFIGLVGSLILVIVPSTLSDLHGDNRGVAFSEANLTASLISVTAPLLVGWAAHLPGGWRLTLGLAALTPLLMRVAFGRMEIPNPSSAQTTSKITRTSLPVDYWIYWSALFLAVAVEFCMVFWSADYLENILGMDKILAAQAVSLFLGGMIIGRLIGSRLVMRFSTHLVLLSAAVLAGVGFLLFWMAGSIPLGLLGLFLSGLGIASLYPLILALALGTAKENPDQASARANLASGAAILTLPLILGRLADAAGIQLAYSIIAFLLAGIFLIIFVTLKKKAPRQSMASN